MDGLFAVALVIAMIMGVIKGLTELHDNKPSFLLGHRHSH